MHIAHILVTESEKKSRQTVDESFLNTVGRLDELADLRAKLPA